MWHKKFSIVLVLSIVLLQSVILLFHDQQIRQVKKQVYHVTLSRDAFVQIETSFDLGFPTPVIFRGSGTLIGKDGNKNYALTANHLCHPYIPEFATNQILDKIIFVTDFSGEIYFGNVVFNSLNNDLCLIEFEGDIDTEPVTVAPEPALINEKVYTFAAPAGFFAPHVIPLFEGHYAGDIVEGNGVSSTYTVAAVGGSSGAAILNANGEVVGVIHSSLVEFHHIMLGATHGAVVTLLEEYSVLSGIIFLSP